MNAKKLDRLLRTTGRRQMAVASSRAGFLAVAILVAAALAAMLADAVFALPAILLVAADVLLGALAAGVLVYVVRAVVLNRFRPRRIARLIEQRTGRTDSRLINAVDLAASPPAPAIASGELAGEAVRQGEAAAAAVKPQEVVGLVPLRKPGLALSCVAAAVGILILAAPDLLRSTAARLLDPQGKHPPFTFLRFDVQIEPGRVFEGEPATITARLAGGEGLISLPEEANVVLIDSPQQRALPMVHKGKGLFLLQIEQATERFRFCVDTPSGRSGVYTLSVLPAPRFVSAQVTYEYPAYTGWDARAEPLGEKGLRALAGTTARIRVTADQPLARTAMTVHPPAGGGQTHSIVLEPDPADENAVAGTMVLSANGRFELRLLAASGAAGREVREGPIACLPDLPPTVEILEPQPLLVAPANWRVHAVVHARDDVGIARLQMARSINGFGPYPTDLPVPPAGAVDAVADYDFDLPALGVQPGDVITYFASVLDNHPGGGQLADSPTQVIHVISEEEYLQYARMAYRMENILAEINGVLAKLRELEEKKKKLIEDLEALKKRCEDESKPLSDEEAAELERLQKELAKLNEEIKALAEKLAKRAAQPQIYDFETEYAEMLRRLAEKLRQQAEKIEEPKRTLERLTREQERSPKKLFIPLSQALGALGESEFLPGDVGQEIELTQEEFRKLMKADALLAAAERIVAITKRQRELADQLGQFRNKEQLSPTEQLRARRLAADQKQLAGDLTDALQEIEKRAADAQADLPTMAESAREIVAKIRELGVAGDQQDAARLAEVGQGRYAHRAAEKAAEKLEGLLDELTDEGGQPMDGLQGDGVGDLDGRLRLTRERIAKSLRQLAQGRGIPGGKPGTGGTGPGYYGSRAPVMLAGPHAGGEGPVGRGDIGRGPWKPTGDPTAGGRPAGEQIDPGGNPERLVGGGGMPGVPVRYRPQAEAYFRRLADDSK